MKTLIFNGSPRRQGDTAAMLDVLRAQLGGEFHQIDAYTCGIRPCIDCRWCFSHAGCVVQDEMQAVYRHIDEADNIVIASPIYFSELTGSLLSVMSRLQALWVSKFIRKEPLLREKTRQGVILLAGGGDGTADKAISTATCLIHQMGAEVAGIVCSHDTNHIPAAQDAPALAQIRQIADTLKAGQS